MKKQNRLCFAGKDSLTFCEEFSRNTCARVRWLPDATSTRVVRGQFFSALRQEGNKREDPETGRAPYP